MRTIYLITRWASLPSPKALAHHACYRAPSAHDRLYEEVRAMCEVEGLLDRPVCLALIKRVLEYEVSPPKRGHYHHETFKLRENDPYSAYVEFWARRL